MTTGGYSRTAAVFGLTAGGLLIAAIAAIAPIAAVMATASVAAGQDAQPPPPPPPGGDSADIAERMRQRGIDVSPEQIDRARRVMEDIRDGIPPDPNQLQQVFGDIRKQVEKQQQKRLQEELGATDEEWKIIGPKIEKVRTLRRLLGDDGAAGGMPGGPGGMLGAAGGMLGRAMPVRNTDPNAEPAEIETKSQALQTVLGDKQAKPEAVAASLKAYRDARAKAKLDLAKAQQELKDVLTIRQEAQLVTLAILD